MHPILDFIKGKKEEYNKEGLIPTIDLLIEDIEKDLEHHNDRVMLEKDDYLGELDMATRHEKGMDR